MSPRQSPGEQLKHDPSGEWGRWCRAHTHLSITPPILGLSTVCHQLTVSVPSTGICGSAFLALTALGSCVEFMTHSCLTHGCKAHVYRGSGGRLGVRGCWRLPLVLGPAPAGTEGALC